MKYFLYYVLPRTCICKVSLSSLSVYLPVCQFVSLYSENHSFIMVNNSEMAKTGPVRGPWTRVHSRVQLARNGTLKKWPNKAETGSVLYVKVVEFMLMCMNDGMCCKKVVHCKVLWSYCVNPVIRHIVDCGGCVVGKVAQDIVAIQKYYGIVPTFFCHFLSILSLHASVFIWKLPTTCHCFFFSRLSYSLYTYFLPLEAILISIWNHWSWFWKLLNAIKTFKQWYN